MIDGSLCQEPNEVWVTTAIRIQRKRSKTFKFNAMNFKWVSWLSPWPIHSATMLQVYLSLQTLNMPHFLHNLNWFLSELETRKKTSPNVCHHSHNAVCQAERPLCCSQVTPALSCIQTSASAVAPDWNALSTQAHMSESESRLVVSDFLWPHGILQARILE